MRKWIRRFFAKKPLTGFKTAKEDEPVMMLGLYAKDALNNPAFDACFKKIEADLLFAWKTSPPKAEQEREHLYYRMEGLAKIKTKLIGMMNNMLQEEQLLKQRQSSQGEAQEESLWTN